MNIGTIKDVMKMKLSSYASNIYSQWGEDGIVEKIFQIIDADSKVCIEFGAWDGFHLSNTANLWSNKGWKGILIEGDRARFDALQDNIANYDCVCINAYVSKDGQDSLESILFKSGVVTHIDLLSIDIDGNDYHIFDSLNTLRPSVIICEYNPTIPAHYDVYQEYGNGSFGSSVSALLRVARVKGYILVGITDTNCFFVLDKYEDLFSGYEIRLDKIRIDKYLSHLITSYGGDYVISADTLPYGCNFPYKGSLLGDVRPIHFKPPALKLVYWIIKKIRAYVVRL